MAPSTRFSALLQLGRNAGDTCTPAGRSPNGIGGAQSDAGVVFDRHEVQAHGRPATWRGNVNVLVQRSVRLMLAAAGKFTV